jgi:hypothetical protein
MRIRGTLTDRSLKLICLLIIPAVLFVTVPPVFASQDFLDNRYDQISDSTASVPAIHHFGLDISNTSVPIGSLSFEFCENTPIIGDSCIAPSGLDLSGITLSSQQGETGFSISGLSTANKIILTRSAALPAGGTSEYIFDNVINPDSPRSYYVRLQTFTSTDGTGVDIESGGVVFALINALNIATEVPPYLKFCAAITITAFDCTTATDYLIDFGEFSRTVPSAGTSQLVAATNAGFGYSVTVTGTTLFSGTNAIPAIFPGGGSVPGTSQFGFNLRANTIPSVGTNPQGLAPPPISPNYNVPNIFRFQDGDIIVSSPNSSSSAKFTVSYIVNINASQAAGYYAATLTYICLANF